MPTGTIAYKTAPVPQAEVLDLDERLWDHIRLATTFIQRQTAYATPQDNASAVVVRRAGGEPVVVVLLDRNALPAAGGPFDVCRRFHLTPRETEVALLLAERMSCREIANRLEMSFNTARCHTEKIMAKLGVRSKNDVSARLGVNQ